MTDFAPAKNEALTTDELDRVAGGIIIVGGLQRQLYLGVRVGRAQSAAAPAEGILRPLRPLIAAFQKTAGYASGQGDVTRPPQSWLTPCFA